MIATAAESNPSCFSPGPLVDADQILIPDYLRLVSLSVAIIGHPLTLLYSVAI